jgi:hypothetical protein
MGRQRTGSSPHGCVRIGVVVAGTGVGYDAALREERHRRAYNAVGFTL